MNKTNAEVLNLSEGMVNTLIKQTEKSIFDETMQMEQLRPRLEELEMEYHPLKKAYTEIEGRVEELKRTLDVLIGYKENENDRKKIRVLKSVSNADNPGTKRPKEFNWLKLALTVLREMDCFIKPETLVDKMFNKYPATKVAFNKFGEENLKHKLAGNFVRSATLPKTKKIVMYNGKIGLPEWVDRNGIVYPQHLSKAIKTAI